MAKNQKTGGRLKGTPNKTTQNVKMALCEAFENMGGVAALVAWAKEKPDDFYRLWGRMAPKDMNAQQNDLLGEQTPFQITFNMGEPSALKRKREIEENSGLSDIYHDKV